MSADDKRKAPADFLELGEQLAQLAPDDPHELLDGLVGDVGAHTDQVAAAFRDSHRDVLAVARAAGLIGETDTVPDPGMPDPARLLAMQLSLFAATDRRVPAGRRCRHTFDPATPTFVFLGPGTTLCRACGLAPVVSIVDDGRCDLCDAPSSGFWPAILGVGGAQFHFDTCESCAQFIRSVAPTP